LLHEIDNLRQDIQLNGYPPQFTDSVLKSRGNSHLREKKKALSIVSIPSVRSISEKFKCMGNCYNISTIFKTTNPLRSLIMKTRAKRDPKQIPHCIHSISCECRRNLVGETDRPLAVHLHEHRHNLKLGVLEKSKVAQHAYMEGHRVGWEEDRVFEIESDGRCRKHKESAHTACLAHLISQLSLEFSSI
jgi:hypothetical protein